MWKYVVLDIELGAIKDFLSKTLEAVDTEMAIICERDEASEFCGLDDLANALFVPMQREAIAIRAVFYEINALVEWELYGLASKPYWNSPRHAATSKSPGDVPIDEASSIKTVHDIPIGKARRLIERYYRINLSDVSGFAEVQHVRQVVNAFKHLKGFKDFRRDVETKVGEKLQPTRENASEAIDAAGVFLSSLWRELKV